jgi:3-phenylpropionate/cinnamic acid dioxygenase small subunit
VRIDRDNVDRLFVEYVNTIDDGDLEHWPELFTADCSYRIASRENARRNLPLAAMRCDSREMLYDRVAAIESSAFYVSRAVRHIVGSLDVRMSEGEGSAAAVRANFAIFQSLPRSATTLLCAGVYDDVVVVDDGRLRFRQKHCIYDGDLVTDSIVYPF